MTPLALLELRAVTFRHADAPNDALHAVDLVLSPGSCLALIGANGSGKSTLLLHLNGLLRPQRGEVWLRGKRAAYGGEALRAWRSSVGLLFQDPDDQLFAPTVLQDVSFGPLNQGCGEREARRLAEVSLEQLAIAHLADREPQTLSFGQKRRVALAGVLAMGPDLIVLDEPTAGLDHEGEEELKRT